MEELRDNNGYIVLDNLQFEMVNNNLKQLIFYIDGKKYYFKPINDKNEMYNELIAEELSKDYGIKCAHYDIANYKGLKGVISEDFIKDNKYVAMSSIVSKYYKENKNENSHNNLMDIWSAFDYRYKDENISNKLMEELVNVFIFDILIANSDRHLNNYGVLENEKEVNIAPIFDNSYLLSIVALTEGEYCLGVDEEENIFDSDYNGNRDKFLAKFLKESSSEYRDLVESKLWIINNENIDKVLNRIEEKINCKIDEEIKEKIKLNFNLNYENIKYTIEYLKGRKL